MHFKHRDYEPDNPVIPIITPAWAQIILRLKGYAETGQPPAVLRLLRWPLDVTASLVIDAPPDAVARVQFDPSRDPEWIGGVDRVELVTPPPLAVGSQVRRIGGFLGRRSCG